MEVTEQITAYINSQTEIKRDEMLTLHQMILNLQPDSRLWFLDGRNEAGKIVTNPNIGYGSQQMDYADGTSRTFYQIGLSANTTGISVYIIGLKDKTYLTQTYGKKIGKATVSGYCIKFKTLKDINTEVLKDAIRHGFETTGEKA